MRSNGGAKKGSVLGAKNEFAAVLAGDEDVFGAVDAAVDLRAEGFDLAPFLEGQGVKGSDLGGILSGTLTGTLKGGQANEILESRKAA